MPNNEIFSSKPRDPLTAIIVSVLVVSILTIYPLSYGMSAWRPSMLFLLMLYWMICQPTWCGVWFAFGLGIFTDLLLDAPLGLNALFYVLISFVIRFYTRDRSIMGFWNLWLVSSIALAVYLCFMWFSFSVIDPQLNIARHWQPLLSSVLLWPILFYSLRKWRHL